MAFFTYLASGADFMPLYVGRATRKEVWRRFAEHRVRSGSEWHTLARQINVFEHDTHDSMRAHEQYLWEIMKPPYNARTPGGGGAPIFVTQETIYRKDALGRWHASMVE